jgi:hypothetical protein
MSMRASSSVVAASKASRRAVVPRAALLTNVKVSETLDGGREHCRNALVPQLLQAHYSCT